MGLLDNFSFANMEKNLLGSTPEEQSKSLLSISSALRSPTKRGESAFSNVSQAILGGSTERMQAGRNATALVKKEARQRANDFAGLVPSGSTFNDLGEADQLKVKNYIEKDEGAYGDLFALDFGTNSTKAPTTVSGFDSETGAKTTFQWDATGKAWTAIGGGEVSTTTANALSTYGKIAAELVGNSDSKEFTEKVQQLWNEAHAKATGTGPQGTNEDGSTGTSNAQDSASLEAIRVDLRAKVDAGTMSQTQMNARMDIERQIFGGGTDPGRTSMAESNNEALVASWKKYDDENESALNSLPSINQSLAIIDEGLYTGTLGEVAADFNKLSISLGFAPVDSNVGAEQFRVNSMKSVMDWIALTKGAISEAEMEAFAAASPGLSRTVEGNRMILTTARKAAVWKQRRSAAYDRIYTEASKNNTIPNARKLTSQIKKWERENKLTLPSPAQIKAAQAGKALSNATAAAQNQSNAIPMPASWTQGGGTPLAWAGMSDADKNIYLGL